MPNEIKNVTTVRNGFELSSIKYLQQSKLYIKLEIGLFFCLSFFLFFIHCCRNRSHAKSFTWRGTIEKLGSIFFSSVKCVSKRKGDAEWTNLYPMNSHYHRMDHFRWELNRHRSPTYNLMPDYIRMSSQDWICIGHVCVCLCVQMKWYVQYL